MRWRREIGPKIHTRSLAWRALLICEYGRDIWRAKMCLHSCKHIQKMASKHSQTCSCTNHKFVITEALTCSEHVTNHVHTCEGPVTQKQHLYLKITGCNLDTYDTNIMWPLGQLPEWIRQISIATRNANISSKAVSHPAKVFLSCKRVTSPQ